MAIDSNTIDGFVASDGLAVEVADVNNITVSFHQVDVGIAVDSNKAFCLLTPADECNMGVAETVDLVVGGDGLIVLVILVEVVGGHHKEIVVSILYLLDIVIRQVIAPGANLSVDR